MPNFLVLAYDGTDADSEKRRQLNRPAHTERTRPMVENGLILKGGSMMDDKGKIIGSAVFVDFPTRAALDEWLTTDPYVVTKVWQRVEVIPMQMAAMPPRAG